MIQFKKLQHKVSVYLHKSIEKKWYFPFIFLIAVLTVFITFFSVDIVLIATILLKPSYWIKTALILSSGSALGASIFSSLIKFYGLDFFQQYYFHSHHAAEWAWMIEFFNKYDILAIIVLVLSPFPLTPMVALLSTFDVSVGSIFISVLVGRTIKYLLIGKIVSLAPHYFHKKFHSG